MAELLLERTEPSTTLASTRAIVGSVPAPGAPLPAPLLAHLLRQVAAMPIERIGDLLPALQILALVVVSAVVLRITAATLEAVDGVPLVGGLLELVGLAQALSFLSRHALRQQRRAELMVRIDQLRRDLLG